MLSEYVALLSILFQLSLIVSTFGICFTECYNCSKKRKRVKKSTQEEEDQKDDNEVENEEDPDLKSQELPESSVADGPNPLDQSGMAETHDPNNQPLGQQCNGNDKAAAAAGGGGGGGSSKASAAGGPKAPPAAQGGMTTTQDPNNQTLVAVGDVTDKGVGGDVQKVSAAFEPSGKQDSNNEASTGITVESVSAEKASTAVGGESPKPPANQSAQTATHNDHTLAGISRDSISADKAADSSGGGPKVPANQATKSRTNDLNYITPSSSSSSKSFRTESTKRPKSILKKSTSIKSKKRSKSSSSKSCSVKSKKRTAIKTKKRSNSSSSKFPSVIATPPTQTRPKQRPKVESTEDEPDWGDSHEDFDEIYKNNEETVEKDGGNVASHLLSQVSIGMDLTKVTLPTSLLERRSLLEMYADLFAHPDDFLKGTETDNAEERMVAIVKYYLGAFYPARKSGAAKKPYNPVLGETFRCRWTVPGLKLTGKQTADGPFPGSDINQVTFVAEQVSHHPPISAFYAEHPAKRISLSAHILTKSFGLGLSIGVENIGNATIFLQDFDEKYVLTFPNSYGRSIMSSKPWIELGGKVEIMCEKTGYYAEIEFLTKPFLGGKPHKIVGSVFKEGTKKPVMTLKGEWNNVVFAKPFRGKEFIFVDVKEKPEVPKECETVAKQGNRESRKLWRHVTCALFRNKIDIATNAKVWIEQRQRDEAQKRRKSGKEYHPKLFERNGDNWIFKYSLEGKKKQFSGSFEGKKDL